MTVVDLLGGGDELADGTGGTVDAVRGNGNRSVSENPDQTPIAVNWRPIVAADNDLYIFTTQPSSPGD